MLWPAIVVTTGHLPGSRGGNHLYFEIEAFLRPAGSPTARVAGPQELSAPYAVHNADRVVCALARHCSTGHPRQRWGPKKYGIHSGANTLRLVPGSPRYTHQRLIGLGAPIASGAWLRSFQRQCRIVPTRTGRSRRRGSLRCGIIERCWEMHKLDGDAVASMIGRTGLDHPKSKLACASVC